MPRLSRTIALLVLVFAMMAVAAIPAVAQDAVGDAKTACIDYAGIQRCIRY